MKKLKNTAHVMLISNHTVTPMIYLIQEKNKRWGIFGGSQEIHDRNSLMRTAARELQEETVGSLSGNLNFFPYLDSYHIVDSNGCIHKTFIVINSQVDASAIKLDHPQPRTQGEILQGLYVPLYLLLSCIYRKQYKVNYKGQELTLRYFFAEAIRRNKNFLYMVFNKRYLSLTEFRNIDLGIDALNVHDCAGSASWNALTEIEAMQQSS